MAMCKPYSILYKDGKVTIYYIIIITIIRVK